MDIIIIALLLAFMVVSVGLILPALFSTTLLPFWLILFVAFVYAGLLIILITKAGIPSLKRLLNRIQ